MSFAGDVQKWTEKVRRLEGQIFEGVVQESFNSIVEGSPVTGSLGQPVDPDNDPNAGKLRDSWQIDYTSPTEATIATDVDYAPDVEDNVNDAHFRNHGPHSVKLTVAGFPRVVEVVGQRVSNA